MRALTKKAVKDVTRRKLRTTLTVLGIAIGIMGLSAINIASSQIKASYDYTTSKSSSPDIQFITQATDDGLIWYLQQHPNVKTIQADAYVQTRWAVSSGHVPFTIVGVPDMGSVEIGKFQLIAGDYPAAGQILMESSDSGLAPVKVGDTVTFQVRGQPERLKVSGLVKTEGRVSSVLTGQGRGYMRNSDVQDLFKLNGVNAFLVQLKDYDLRAGTAKQLTAVFEQQHVPVLSTVVGHDDNNMSVGAGLFGVMRVLSIVALLLSVFLLLSTVTTLVTEQLPVIGTMKAIGASGGQVMRNYLASVALYGVVGTAIGLALGIAGGYALVSFFGTLLGLDIGALGVSPTLILVSIAIGIGVPVVAAILPIYFGTRITVRQAMSGYGLESGARGSGWARTIGNVFAFLPQTMQLGMRGLFRKRTRALLTLLALVISGAAFLSVQTTAYSFGTFLGQLFTTYNADGMLFFSQPADRATVQRTLATVPGLAATEPMSQNLVTTQWGKAYLTGIEPDSKLYNKQMVSGRWYTATDTNVVVISQDGADKAHLTVGDTIAFHDDLHSATYHVIGIAKDYNGIGLQGFGVLLVPPSEVTSFTHLPASYVDGFMFTSTSAKQADIDALARHIDDTLGAQGYQFNVMTSQQMLARAQSQMNILYVLLYVVAAIVALVGAIGLFNALAMSVLERRREIGILRSMGATGRDVAAVFWTEAVSLGVVAWLLGALVGIPTAYGFVQMLSHLLMAVPFAFNPLSLVWMLVFIVGVASVASCGPVWGAARTKIAQTLRYE